MNLASLCVFAYYFPTVCSLHPLSPLLYFSSSFCHFASVRYQINFRVALGVNNHFLYNTGSYKLSFMQWSDQLERCPQVLPFFFAPLASSIARFLTSYLFPSIPARRFSLLFSIFFFLSKSGDQIINTLKMHSQLRNSRGTGDTSSLSTSCVPCSLHERSQPLYGVHTTQVNVFARVSEEKRSIKKCS